MGFKVVEVDWPRKVLVDRRVLDKSTGEIRIEAREREVPEEVWRYFILGYEPDPE